MAVCYYFGYGSNMSTWRTHKNMPSAQYMITARLKDYTLRFVGFSPNHQGGVATICEEEGSEVWGVVWKMSVELLASLDKQESSSYRRLEVGVASESGEQYRCHVVQHVSSSPTLPSPQYLEIIRSGAVEHHVPLHYLHQLNQVQHNGFKGEIYVP